MHNIYDALCSGESKGFSLILGSVTIVNERMLVHLVSPSRNGSIAVH